MMSVPRPSAVVGRLDTVRRTATLLLSGLQLAVPLSATATTQDAPIARISRVDPHAAFIAEAARRFSMPERWIRAVMRQESGGRLYAADGSLIAERVTSAARDAVGRASASEPDDDGVRGRSPRDERSGS